MPKNNDGHYIVSIDIGSSKIVVLLANEKDGRLEVFGQARGKSAGVHKGEIVDVEAVANAIKAVGEKACLSCNTKFDGAVTNISDSDIRVFNVNPHKHVESGKVKEGDVKSIIKTAEAGKAGKAGRLISSVTHHYVLNKDEHSSGVVVQYPIGERAETLGVNMHIVVASEQKAKNIERGLERNDKKALNLVPSSMASSEPYLTQEQKDDGVCLVDIGSGVMDLSVFKGGGICYSAVIPEGSDRVTNDIANAFKTSFEEAERLKIYKGRAQAKTLIGDKLIPFKQENDDRQYYLSHRSLVEVIEESYLELFALIKSKLEDEKIYRSLNSGFVLVGGGVKIKGCADLMLSCFTRRTKIGCVNTDLIVLPPAHENLSSLEYACALGLLLFNDDERGLEEQQSINKTSIMGKIKEMGRKF